MAAPGDDEDGDEEDEAPRGASYEYLLSMSLSSLTLEKVQALQQEAAQHQSRVGELQRTTARAMWRTDLNAFLEALEAVEAAEQEAVQQLAKQQQRARGGKVRASALDGCSYV